MAVEESVQISERLRNIRTNTKTAIEEALVTSALIVERDAKINAPVDTGRLRVSLSYTTEDFGTDNPAVTIGTNTVYAAAQEFGTSRIPAHPFLFPAFNNNKQRILKELAKAMRKGAGL